MKQQMNPHSELQRLQIKWVGLNSGEPRLNYIQSLILRELRLANDGVIACTNGLKQEMQGELVLCGKIRAAFGMARMARKREVIMVSGTTAAYVRHAKKHSNYRYQEMI
jgi:hypothetical protein